MLFMFTLLCDQLCDETLYSVIKSAWLARIEIDFER